MVIEHCPEGEHIWTPVPRCIAKPGETVTSDTGYIKVVGSHNCHQCAQCNIMRCCLRYSGQREDQ